MYPGFMQKYKHGKKENACIRVDLVTYLMHNSKLSSSLNSG